MNDELLDKFTNDTNRSMKQTKELLELLDHDFSKLIDLEERIKNLHLSGCPSTQEECQQILEMYLPETKWFNLNSWKL